LRERFIGERFRPVRKWKAHGKGAA